MDSWVNQKTSQVNFVKVIKSDRYTEATRPSKLHRQAAEAYDEETETIYTKTDKEAGNQKKEFSYIMQFISFFLNTTYR